MDSLVVSGNLDSLGTIAQYVMDAAKQANLDKKKSYKLRLAVDEIATNIITHGYLEAGLEGDILLCASLEPESLTILIEDTGIAYDPTADPDKLSPDIGQSLEERPIGGLGLFLVVDGVDKFSYERVDDKNRNILVVNLPASY